MVFDGSRYDSSFRTELGLSRSNHPSLPCLNALAGFAAGEWFTVGEGAVRLDLLFGELTEAGTSGVLLIEKEGENYEKTYWGQPKWPLFLTELPTASEREELGILNLHMERKLMGAFSVSDDALWLVDSVKPGAEIE